MSTTARPWLRNCASMSGRRWIVCGPNTRSTNGARVGDALAFLAGHATAHADDDVRARGFQVAPAAELREHFLLRLLAHGARVEQQQVGLFRILGGLVAAAITQYVRHPGGVVLVHLAAEGLEVNARHGAASIRNVAATQARRRSAGTQKTRRKTVTYQARQCALNRTGPRLRRRALVRAAISRRRLLERDVVVERRFFRTLRRCATTTASAGRRRTAFTARLAAAPCRHRRHPRGRRASASRWR